MNDQRVGRTLRRSAPASRNAPGDLQNLLNSWWVRGVLGCTLALTLVGALGDASRSGKLARNADASLVIPLEPVSAKSPSVAEAWKARAIERESQRLAAEYTRRGYRVSPQLAFDIHEAALRYEIDPQVAFGLVRAESSFRNNATSPVGATGLTQLMPRTAAWMQPGVTRADLRDQRTNLDIGFRYLRYLVDKYDGDTRLALLAYNRGPGTVDRALRRGNNPDNGYADFVMGKENHGHKLFTNQRRPAQRARTRSAR